MVKIYKQPFAHDGDTIAIPDASQPDGKMSSADGWTPDYQLPKTDPNYKPVGRQEMNGVFKEVTEAVGELQQFGFAKWQPMQWPQGARVVEGGVVYRALNQTSQQPPHADWADDSAIGVGQTWQDVSASRSFGVNYTNTTGRAIMLMITQAISTTSPGSRVGVSIEVSDRGGAANQGVSYNGSASNSSASLTLYDTVLPGQSYSVLDNGTASGRSTTWRELTV